MVNIIVRDIAAQNRVKVSENITQAEKATLLSALPPNISKLLESVFATLTKQVRVN